MSSTLGVIGGGLALGIGAAVKGFGDFEAQMNAVAAVSGATGDQLAQLSDLAKQIGEDTTFGASKAASALEELAKAGVSTEESWPGRARPPRRWRPPPALASPKRRPPSPTR